MRSSEPPKPRRPWQPRFGIPGLLLVVLIASVLAAAVSYLARMDRLAPNQDGKSSLLVFILITTAAPALLLVILATLLALWRKR